jgi:hypothetical protein
VVLGARVRELDEAPRDVRDAARDERHARLRGRHDAQDATVQR